MEDITQDDKYDKIKTLVTSKAFAKLQADLDLMNEYLIEPDIMPHLLAARTGLAGLVSRFGVTDAN